MVRIGRFRPFKIGGILRDSASNFNGEVFFVDACGKFGRSEDLLHFGPGGFHRLGIVDHRGSSRPRILDAINIRDRSTGQGTFRCCAKSNAVLISNNYWQNVCFLPAEKQSPERCVARSITLPELFGATVIVGDYKEWRPVFNDLVVSTSEEGRAGQ